MRQSIGLFLLCLSLSLNAQDFWKKCSPIPKGEYPYQIQGQGTQICVLSVEGTLFRSDDKGKNWYELLRCEHPASALFVQDQLMLVADSLHTYLSTDAGEHWQKQVFPGKYPPIAFYQSSAGILYALSGDLLSLQKGDWIWRSVDKGQSWQRKSQGLQGNGFIRHLQEDANGRLYTLTADDAQGGALFYSDNQGEHWVKQAILFDGQGAVNDDLYIRQAGSLLVEGDSITIGFQGVAGAHSPAAVRLTLKNHLNLNHTWSRIKLSGSNSFWLDLSLWNAGYNGCSAHYASFGASVHTGGAFIKAANGNWERRVSGLNLTPLGYQGMEISSLSNGALIALQWDDQAVYYSDSLACYPLGSPHVNSPKEAVLYPQPAGNWFSLELGHSAATQYRIYAMQGQLLQSGALEEHNSLLMLKPGIYLLVLINSDGQSLQSLRLVHF